MSSLNSYLIDMVFKEKLYAGTLLALYWWHSTTVRIQFFGNQILLSTKKKLIDSHLSLRNENEEIKRVTFKDKIDCVKHEKEIIFKNHSKNGKNQKSKKHDQYAGTVLQYYSYTRFVLHKQVLGTWYSYNKIYK